MHTPNSKLDAQNGALLPAAGLTVHLCSAQPTSYAGIAAVELGKKLVVGTVLNSDGTPDGRMSTVPAQTDIPITGAASPTPVTHVAYSNGADTLHTAVDADTPHVDVVNGGTAGCGAYSNRISPPSAA